MANTMTKSNDSIIQLSNYSIVKLFNCFIVTLVVCFIVSLIHCSILVPPVFAADPGGVMTLPTPTPTSSEELKRFPSEKTTDLMRSIYEEGFFQTNIGIFLSKAIDAIIVAGGLLVLLFLLWGAVEWLTSEGDKEKLTGARDKIIHAIIGLAILVSIYAVWRLVIHFLGLGNIFP